MLSIDTNLLFHAYNQSSPVHRPAHDWVASIPPRQEVVISEFVLAELYRLLRNPTVLTHPLSASDAVGVVQAYRQHPRWRLVGFAADSRQLHDELWDLAADRSFACRRLYDVRNALTLEAHGVTELATTNVGDFEGLGFERVWNPLEA